jgi:hypothetical protein
MVLYTSCHTGVYEADQQACTAAVKVMVSNKTVYDADGGRIAKES